MSSPESQGGYEAGFPPELLIAHEGIRRSLDEIDRGEAHKQEAIDTALEAWASLIGERLPLKGLVVARAFEADDGSIYTRRFFMEGEPASVRVSLACSPLVAVIGPNRANPDGKLEKGKSVAPKAGGPIYSDVGNVLIVKLNGKDRGKIRALKKLTYVKNGELLGLDIQSLTSMPPG